MNNPTNSIELFSPIPQGIHYPSSISPRMCTSKKSSLNSNRSAIIPALPPLPSH
ncbi:hypothetical protein LguiA_012146 [Lonicera macranthoides]